MAFGHAAGMAFKYAAGMAFGHAAGMRSCTQPSLEGEGKVAAAEQQVFLAAGGGHPQVGEGLVDVGAPEVPRGVAQPYHLHPDGGPVEVSSSSSVIPSAVKTAS